MADSKYKDIVEEVFSKSTKTDGRVSAIFAHLQNLPQVSPEKEQMSFRESKDSNTAKDTGSSVNKPFQAGKNASYGSFSKRTIKNKEPVHRTRKVAVAGLIGLAFALAFLSGGYIRQQEIDPTKTRKEKQYVNRSQIAGPVKNQSLPNIQPDSVQAKIIQNSMPLDLQDVINWSRLLDQISATIPKTVQLSVLESGDGTQMFLEGRALSADALYDFVDALGTNSQVKSAELTQTRIGKWNLQKLLKFSISCSLVPDTKTPGSGDGDYNNSGFERGKLFTPAEAEEFFDNTQSITEQTGCKVEALLLSPKDAVFEDEKTYFRIVKKHAVLTLLGGYQNILKAFEKLQNRPQHVWFDSVSIQEQSGTGRLECSTGISVYVAEGAGQKN